MRPLISLRNLATRGYWSVLVGLGIALKCPQDPQGNDSRTDQLNELQPATESLVMKATTSHGPRRHQGGQRETEGDHEHHHADYHECDSRPGTTVGHGDDEQDRGRNGQGHGDQRAEQEEPPELAAGGSTVEVCIVTKAIGDGIGERHTSW